MCSRPLLLPEERLNSKWPNKPLRSRASSLPFLHEKLLAVYTTHTQHPQAQRLLCGVLCKGACVWVMLSVLHGEHFTLCDPPQQKMCCTPLPLLFLSIMDGSDTLMTIHPGGMRQPGCLLLSVWLGVGVGNKGATASSEERVEGRVVAAFATLCLLASLHHIFVCLQGMDGRHFDAAPPTAKKHLDDKCWRYRLEARWHSITLHSTTRSITSSARAQHNNSTLEGIRTKVTPHTEASLVWRQTRALTKTKTPYAR